MKNKTTPWLEKELYRAVNANVRVSFIQWLFWLGMILGLLAGIAFGEHYYG